jgi:hypothetical protein
MCFVSEASVYRLLSKSLSSLHHLCLTSRDFVPWRFLDAGQLSVRSLFVAGVQKPAQEGSG